MPVNLKKKVPQFPVCVMGLDVSTHTGCVVLGEGGAVHEQVEICLPPLPNDAGMEKRMGRCSHLQSEVENFLRKHRPHVIAVEGYSFASMHKQTTLVELGAFVRMALIEYISPFSTMGAPGYVRLLEVAPSSLKKFVLGKGVGPKEQVMMQVFKRWRYEAPTNNLADAYVLARIAGAALPGNKENLTTPMAEVMKKILKSC